MEGVPQTGRGPIIVGLISSDYTRTMGIPLVAGRGLSTDDVVRAGRVALINQAAARLWPSGQEPVGKRIHLSILERPQGSALLPPGDPAADAIVVGILADTRNDGLREPPAPAVFLPYTVIAPPGRTLALRSRNNNPMVLLNAVREQVRQLNKDLPLGRPITMEEILGDQAEQPRFNMALFSFFGGLGSSLAAIGIFSVLSYSVARRTHEIGIRMALGAERGHVLTLMFSMGAKLVVTGLAIGIAGSLLLARLLKSQVFQGAGDRIRFRCLRLFCSWAPRPSSPACCRRGGRLAWTPQMPSGMTKRTYADVRENAVSRDGKTATNVAPLPGSLRTDSVPPCASIMLRAIDSPRPVPPVSRDRARSTR